MGRRKIVRRTAMVWLILVGVPILISSCDDGVPSSGPGETIRSEAFIQAMVELRVQAFERPGGVLSAAEAESILQSEGLAPPDLLRFVEVHGQNVPLMNGVWAEVSRRLEELDADAEP